MRKWIVRVLIIVFAAPVVSLMAWYGLSFLPYISEINKLADSGVQKAQPVIVSLNSYVVAAESKEGIRVHAIRQAYRSLVFSKNRSGNLSWHANNALWYLASYMHFSGDEVFGIWVSCALSGCGKGLPDAAMEYYGKDMQSMNDRELAGLVALVRSPSRFKPGSPLSEERIEYILNKVKSHNTSLQPMLALSRLLG